MKWVCRVCGCTESNACLLDIGGIRDGVQSPSACWWVTPTLCSNPRCLAVVPLLEIEIELEQEEHGSVTVQLEGTMLRAET